MEMTGESDAPVTLLDALYAFFQGHQYCGDLDGGVEGDRGWMTCASRGRMPASASRRSASQTSPSPETYMSRGRLWNPLLR